MLLPEFHLNALHVQCCFLLRVPAVLCWLHKPDQSVADAAGAQLKANRGWSQVLCSHINQQRQLESHPQGAWTELSSRKTLPVRLPWSQKEFCQSLQAHFSVAEKKKKSVFSMTRGYRQIFDIFMSKTSSIIILFGLKCHFSCLDYYDKCYQERLQTGYGEDMEWIYNSKSLDYKWNWLKRQHKKYFQVLVFVFSNFKNPNKLKKPNPSVKEVFSMQNQRN